MDFSNQSLLIYGSSILAALSFMAFALPFLNRAEKKDRYRSVIEKKRKALFDQTIDNLGKRTVKDEKTVSAAESIALVFKIRQMLGGVGEMARDQLLQAGIRDPKAPVYYIIGAVVLPLILMGFTSLIMIKGEKEFSGLMIMVATLGMGAAGVFMPRLLIKNHIIKRQEEIGITFPDALDMMLICVQGGIGLEQTIDRVAGEVADHSEILAEELGILSAEMGMLSDPKQALQDFGRRVGSGAARSFVTAIVQALQYGTSVTGAMRVISDDLRDQRMAEAERKAASLPPKLTVPMILFFLPALFVVILGPAFLQASAAGVGN